MYLYSTEIKTFYYLLAICACLFCSLERGSALECYVCKNQADNKDKCVETVKTCDGDEERCLNEVRWGSTPYWAPSGEKQYYISKKCASIKFCEDSIRNLTRRCDRIWYNDWECVECCQGDRCNYYVTLMAPFTHPNIVLLVVCALMGITITIKHL